MAKTLRSSRGPARLSARPTCPSKLGTAVSEKTVCLTESRSADATTTARRGECCAEQTPARRRRRGRTGWVPSACHLKTRNFKFYAFIENFFIPRKRTRSPAGALFPRAVCWMERLHLTSLCLCPRGTRRGLEGGGQTHAQTFGATLSSSFFIPISPRPGSDPWVLQHMGEDRFSATGPDGWRWPRGRRR